MKTVRRFDTGKLDSLERTPQGFLKAPLYATRTGVFKYRTPKGDTIGELRLAEEVFKPESMATLASVPVTLRHPPDLVSPSNFPKYGKGYLLESVSQDGDKIAATAIIADEQAIKAVEEGMREVSCGYTADLEPAEGIFEGEPYQFIQRNIRYNHLAIVDRGRAGPEVALRLDSDDNQVFTEDSTMQKVMLSGKEFEVSPELAAALQAHMSQMEDGYKAKMSDMEVKMKDMAPKADMEKKHEEMQAKMDQLESELSKAKERKDSAPADVRELVKARLAAEKVAITLGVEKADELSDVELKKASILKDSPKASLEGKTETYISARFDSIAEKLVETEAQKKALGESLTRRKETKADSDVSAEAARKKMIERDNALWKGNK